MSTEVPPMQPLIPGEVVAVGSAVVSHLTNFGAMAERAMVDAIHACHAAGITDDAAVLAAKMRALEDTKKAFDAASGGS
jgi:hypothetical protein